MKITLPKAMIILILLSMGFIILLPIRINAAYHIRQNMIGHTYVYVKEMDDFREGDFNRLLNQMFYYDNNYIMMNVHKWKMEDFIKDWELYYKAKAIIDARETEETELDKSFKDRLYKLKDEN